VGDYNGTPVQDLPDNRIVDIVLGKEKPPVWLVPDFLLQGHFVCWAGDSNVGKSLTLYQLGIALAAGVPCFGGVVPAGAPKRVLYYDEENNPADREKYIRQAFNGLIAGNHGEDIDADLLHDNFFALSERLGMEGWEDQLAYDVETFKPHVFLIDTAATALNLENENDNSEASRNIKTIKRIQSLVTPRATSMILRHAKTTKDENGARTMRGAKTWRNQADQVIFHVRRKGRPRNGGLYNTELIPNKVRAYGLRDTIQLTPSWEGKHHEALVLNGRRSLWQGDDDDTTDSGK
jgi:hypothetical protein